MPLWFVIPEGDLLFQPHDTATHPALIAFTTGGWPMVLSSLKSLLESGSSFEMTRSLM